MSHWQQQAIGCGQCQKPRTHETEICDRRGTHPRACAKPAYHEVELCDTTPKRSLQTNKVIGFFLPCLPTGGACDHEDCVRHFPPRECPKDCLQPVQRCAVRHHVKEALVLLALFIVFALGAVEVYGHGAPEPAYVAGLDVILRPSSWLWGAHIFFFIWLASGSAIIIRTAFRSDEVVVSLQRQYYLLVGLVAWIVATVAWFLATGTTHLWVSVIALAVGTVALHLEYDRVYLRGNQVPPMRVYAFFIAGIAFAAAWSIVVTIFNLNVLLVSLGADGITDGDSATTIVLLVVGYAVGLGLGFWAASFVYTSVLTMALGALWMARQETDGLGIAIIVMFVLVAYFTFVFFWHRVVSNECRHGLEMFVLRDAETSPAYTEVDMDDVAIASWFQQDFSGVGGLPE